MDYTEAQINDIAMGFLLNILKWAAGGGGLIGAIILLYLKQKRKEPPKDTSIEGRIKVLEESRERVSGRLSKMDQDDLVPRDKLDRILGEIIKERKHDCKEKDLEQDKRIDKLEGYIDNLRNLGH